MEVVLGQGERTLLHVHVEPRHASWRGAATDGRDKPGHDEEEGAWPRRMTAALAGVAQMPSADW